MQPLRYFALLLSLFFALAVQAAPQAQQADAAYKKNNYTLALQLYEQALLSAEKEKASDEAQAALYYNVGNCYYRLQNYARAVLSYQRALRLNPANDDAAFNLELTQTKLSDHFDAPAEMFFVTWVKKLTHSQSSKAWGLWGLGFFLLALATFAAYYLMQRIGLRKLSFTFACLFAVGFVLCNIFAYVQHRRYAGLEQAVVMQTTDTFDSPAEAAKKIRTLHEGTLLTLVDTYKGGWLQVELPDGNQAWLKENSIERVVPKVAQKDVQAKEKE